MGSIGAAAWWSIALDDSDSEEEQESHTRRREVVSVTVERRARAHREMVAVPKPAYLIVRAPFLGASIGTRYNIGIIRHEMTTRV